MDNLHYITLLVASFWFTTHPQDQFIYINEPAMFECAAKGESLTISWTKNDGRVHDALKSHILNENTDGGRRSILKVKKSKIADSGYYQCTATNTDNKVVSSKPAELLSKITSPK